MLTKINSYRCFSAKKILQFLTNYISDAIWLDKPSFINFSRNRRIMMIVFKCINAFFHHKTARCSIAYLFQSTWNRVCISSLRFCFSWLPEMPGPIWWLETLLLFEECLVQYGALRLFFEECLVQYGALRPGSFPHWASTRTVPGEGRPPHQLTCSSKIL